MHKVDSNIVGMIAGCLILAGCSSATQSGRANFESGRKYNQSLAYGLGPMSSRATGEYGSTGVSAGLAARRFSGSSDLRAGDLRRIAPAASHRSSGPTSSAGLIIPPAQRRRPQPLRRFAAMSRHKPHAPHVRQHEGACLRSGIVQLSRFIRPRSSIGGGSCYISKPFRMSAAAKGRIRFEPAATLRCQMVPSVETWVREILRPAARRFLGSDVVQLRIAASYACRSRNSKAGAKLSEHGKANAIDISNFKLANGKVITVKHGWRGAERERRFLRYVHRGACEHFSTVLGPNADRHHRDHFHFDLARHGRRGTFRVCK